MDSIPEKSDYQTFIRGPEPKAQSIEPTYQTLIRPTSQKVADVAYQTLMNRTSQKTVEPIYQKIIEHQTYQGGIEPPPERKKFAGIANAISKLTHGAARSVGRAVRVIQQAVEKLGPRSAIHMKQGQLENLAASTAFKEATRAARREGDFVKVDFKGEKIFVSPQGKVYLATGDVRSGMYKDTYKVALIGHPSKLKVEAGTPAKFKALSIPKNVAMTDLERKEIENEMFIHTTLKSMQREAKKANQPDPLLDIGIGRTFTNPKTGQKSVLALFFEGGNLKEFLMEEVKQVPLEVKNQIALKLLVAIEQLHSAGVVHRDLKPDNIMLEKRTVLKDGKEQVIYSVKIVDLGKASFTDPSHRYLPDTLPLKYVPADPGYEEIFHPTLDMYSLGVVLTQLYGGISMNEIPLFHSVRDGLEKSYLANEPWMKSPPEIPREIQGLILDLTQTGYLRRPAPWQAIEYLNKTYSSLSS